MSAPPFADPPLSPSRDTVNAPIKHPWSQIVRSGDAGPSSKKSSQVASPEQIPTIAKAPEANRVRGSTQTDMELGIVPSQITMEDKADARVFDEASLKGEEASQASKIAADAPESEATNAVAADGAEASQTMAPDCGTTEARVSRPTWRKPLIVTEGEIKSQPVMGATAWPALTEARNMKISDTRKPKAKTPPPLAFSTVQESPSSHSGEGATYQQGGKHKPSFRGGSLGIGRPAFQPIENGASSMEHPALGPHRGSEQPIKHNPHVRMKGNFPANQPMDNDRFHHRSDGGGLFSNNNRKWRSGHRDPGRGNFGWQHHGRAYENGNDMVTLLHEQRIGPRNMPRPPQPYMNMNLPFYPIPPFQNGGMYYVPPGAPDFLHGSPYFPPMVPPGGVMRGPDPVALRSMLLKQIDYYFSVENLCRDVFLRTHMDEEGFVPVSVIAQFNRIRSLSPNPIVILEALQHSAVVEVQHDRIRRRNDRGKWRLFPDQVYAVTPVQDNFSLRSLSEGALKKPEQAFGGASSLEELSSSSTKVSDIPESDAENELPRSDRVNGNGECIGLEERGRQQCLDGTHHANTQHSSLLLDTDASSARSFSPRVSSTEETAVNSLAAGDSSGHQNLTLNSSQHSTKRMERDVVGLNKEACLSNSRVLKESSMTSQATVDGKPLCWETPKGFWMENKSYCVQGGFEQDDTPSTEPSFILKPDEDGDGHHGEASDREMQPLMSVPHTPLGSFIAVP